MSTNRLPPLGSNGHERNGKEPTQEAPANVSGAIPLDAVMLKARVAEVLSAAWKEAMPRAPTIVEPIGIIHRGALSSLDVGFVRSEYEKRRWMVVRQLTALGIDPESGEWGLDLEGGVAASTPEGFPVAQFLLSWTPKEAGGGGVEPRKPTLVAT